MEEDIITEITVLQGCLDKLIHRTEQCDFALQQFRAFQLTLFALNSLPEMIAYLLTETKQFFVLESSSLVLIDPDTKIASHLAEAGYDYQQAQNLVLLQNKQAIADALTHSPFIGHYDPLKQSVLFPEQLEPPVEVIIIPLVRHGEYLGSLNLSSTKLNALPNRIKLSFVEQLGSSIALCLENHLNFALAQQAYRTEMLAKANNRQFLEKRLAEELARGQRVSASLICILCEVNFPSLKINHDKLQLEAQVLQTAAETIKRQLRITDVFSYYEGKKFAAFLSNVPESIINDMTRRIRTAIEEQVINFSGQIVPLSIVFGHACHALDSPVCDKTFDDIAVTLISNADAHLYAAKYPDAARSKTLNPA